MHCPVKIATRTCVHIIEIQYVQSAHVYKFVDTPGVQILYRIALVVTRWAVLRRICIRLRVGSKRAVIFVVRRRFVFGEKGRPSVFTTISVHADNVETQESRAVAYSRG